MPPALNLHREARRFEYEIAQDLDARRVFLSGAGDEKADVRRRVQYAAKGGAIVRTARLALRVEGKTTQGTAYKFYTLDWQDLVRVADAAGEMPIFAIKFLRAETALALARTSFLEELGFHLPQEAHTINKTRALAAHNPIVTLSVPLSAGRYDRLSVVPYEGFVSNVRRHADYT